MDTRQQLTDPTQIKTYAFAGRATLTLVSKISGRRFTYRISAPRGAEPRGAPLFVSVLTGACNETSYSYVGTLFPAKRCEVIHTKASKVGRDTDSSRLVSWFVAHLDAAVAGRPNKLDQVEVWHEGRCGRCGRKLTVPASIAAGIGPECAMKAMQLSLI